MELRRTELEGFSVIGIEVRTSNKREASRGGAIPQQWERFFKEGMLERIPHRADRNILALYTDYASDRNGEYTYVLGAKVLDASAVPPGMVLKRVPKSRYTVFTTARGPAAKVVPEAWERIWRIEDAAGFEGHRAYKADFEVYGPECRNPQDCHVQIYVGIE